MTAEPVEMRFNPKKAQSTHAKLAETYRMNKSTKSAHMLGETQKELHNMVDIKFYIYFYNAVTLFSPQLQKGIGSRRILGSSILGRGAIHGRHLTREHVANTG